MILYMITTPTHIGIYDHRTASQGPPPHPSNGPDKLGQRVHPLTPATGGKQRKPYYSHQDYERDQARQEQERKAKEALREIFNESERILNLLRTQGAAKLPRATDEEIQLWATTYQIK
jgi:hypothetical protein